MSEIQLSPQCRATLGDAGRVCGRLRRSLDVDGYDIDAVILAVAD